MSRETDFAAADVERLRRGDLRALEAAYRAFGDRVHRTCRHLLGNEADAEDAVQETFLKVFERARQFSGGSSFSTWLYRLTVNLCLHRLEKEKRRRALPLPTDEAGAPADPGASPLEGAQASEAGALLERRLAALSLEHRVVLVLREIDGLSYRDISRVIGAPVGTVMSRLARARECWIVLSRSAEVFAP